MMAESPCALPLASCVTLGNYSTSLSLIYRPRTVISPHHPTGVLTGFIGKNVCTGKVRPL